MSKRKVIPAVPLDDISILLRTLDGARKHERSQGEIVDEIAYNAMLVVEAWADEVARKRASW